MPAKKKGLGKGLGALLGDTVLGGAANPSRKNTAGTQSAVSATTSESASGVDQRVQSIGDIQRLAGTSKPGVAGKAEFIMQIPVEQCQRGRYQPRKAIDEQSLEELAQSIKSQGVMQPITVRPLQASETKGARYEIIAGERRWRACQLAGLDTVPAMVRELADEAAIAMALIENLQRDDLNPMEEAYALERLQQEFDLTHQQIADTVGKSRAAVSNSLRLTSLASEARKLLENGDLEMGHARALLSLPTKQQPGAAYDVVERALTVRQTEALVKQLQEPPKKTPTKPDALDPDIASLQDDLEGKLGVPIQIKHKSDGSGQLLLKYNSLDELDGVLAHIK